MGRKFSILVAFCVVLFGAILAGYWDMLDSQKLREVRDQASASVGRLTGSAVQDGVATPGAQANAPAAAASAAGGTVAGGVSPGAPAAPGNRTASLADTGQPASPSSPTLGSTPLVKPSFDVLRVEPDGSAVLAGQAAPNAKIRLMDGATAIGSVTASPEGDFAVVLDDRLPAGDHEIRIEADKGDGVKAISEQTAIVSVPKPGAGGELLAMVETPNQPSRIINLPTSNPQAEASASDTQPAAPAAPATPRAGTAPAAATVTTAPATSSPPASPAVQPVPGTAEPQTSVASRQPQASKAPASAKQPVAPSTFAVEAVEIENGTIYIAGRAPGTAPVRVYVDNKFVGEDKARANERFLVTAKAPLAVGNHEIRADMVGSDGAVASRVEVPFAKPEGDTMSAVASNEEPAGEAKASPTGEASVPGTGTSSAAAANGTGARPSAMAQANGSSAPARQPQTAGAPSSPSGTSHQTAAANGAAVGGSNEPTKGGGASASPVSSTRLDQSAAAVPNDVAATVPDPAAPIGAPSNAEQSASPTVPADERIETIRQAALEGVHTRVLIRRGDTLWRISRDTYGQGRRYTVIYLANGDQIRNPNRIYPGQLFRLPKEDSKAID